MAGPAVADDLEVSADDRSHEVNRSGRSTRVRATLTGGLAIVVSALLALGVVEVVTLRKHDPIQSQGARQAAATAAARAEVINLITISASTAQKDIANLLAGATAGFRNQFEQAATSFQQTLKAGDVTSTGSVGQVGVVSLQGNTAVLLVASTANVKNASAPKGEPRSYRFKLTLTDENGKWLVSDLAFVA